MASWEMMRKPSLRPALLRRASGINRGATRVRMNRTTGFAEVATVNSRSVKRRTVRPTGARSAS